MSCIAWVFVATAVVAVIYAVILPIVDIAVRSRTSAPGG